MKDEKRLKKFEERFSALRRKRIDPEDRKQLFVIHPGDDKERILGEWLSRMDPFVTRIIIIKASGRDEGSEALWYIAVSGSSQS